VRSVLNQTLTPAEIVVVDDGSDDHPERALAGLPVTVIRTANGGPASARNVGVRHTSADFVALLDSDDELLPAYLESCVSRAQQMDAPIVGTNGQVVSPDGTIQGLYFRKPFPVAHEDQRIELLRRNLLLGASVYRRDLVVNLGGWDESRRVAGAEDYDFLLRAVYSGALLAYADQPLYLLHISPGQFSADRLRSLRARIEVLEKFQETQNDISVLLSTDRTIRRAQRTVNAYRSGRQLDEAAAGELPRATALWWVTRRQFARRRGALLTAALAPPVVARRLLEGTRGAT
jgi:glycosyltransferase involved in cell wall biosynthesis